MYRRALATNSLRRRISYRKSDRFRLNQRDFESAETKGDLAVTVAVLGADTEQTEVAVKYLTGDELGGRGVVFADFHVAGAEVPLAVNTPGRETLAVAHAHLDPGVDVFGLDGGAETAVALQVPIQIGIFVSVPAAFRLSP